MDGVVGVRSSVSDQRIEGSRIRMGRRMLRLRRAVFDLQSPKALRCKRRILQTSHDGHLLPYAGGESSQERSESNEADA